MNYNKIYNDLVNRAQNRKLENSMYRELHHIVPRCLGGSDDKINLVELTPEEHFLCHLLLVKIHPNNSSLVYAANMMCMKNSLMARNNNKRYGWLRRKVAESTRSNLLGRKSIHKNGTKKLIHKEDLDQYLNEGWLIGIPPRNPESIAKGTAARRSTHQKVMGEYYKDPLRCTFCNVGLPYAEPWRLKQRKEKKTLNCGTTECRSAAAKSMAKSRHIPKPMNTCLHCSNQTLNPKYCNNICSNLYYAKHRHRD